MKDWKKEEFISLFTEEKTKSLTGREHTKKCQRRHRVKLLHFP